MKAIFMKNMRVIVLLLLSLLCIPGFGQIYKYIGLEDGLSSRNVYAVQQSNGGFMWFLTDNGIDRYDGSEITNYDITIGGHEFTEYSTSQFVYDKVEDNLWLVTNLGRVVRYNNHLSDFEVMYLPPIYSDQSDVLRSAVSPIDSKGNIWIFIANEVFCYNIRTLEGRKMKLDAPDGIPTYSAIVAKNDTTLYIGTKGGIYTGSIKDDSIHVSTIEVLQPYYINANTLYYHNTSNTLLIGSEDKGIYALKEHPQTVIHDETLLPDVRVTKIIPTNKNDEILFSTNAACVYQMDIHECIPHPFLAADFTTNYRMNTDNVADICIDMDGQLWMCSFPLGLTIRNDSYPDFNWVKRSLIKSNTLNNNSVDCIIEDSDHDLWYATDNGISLYQEKSDEWHTMLSIADKSPNRNHYFLTLCEVKPGVVLAGGYAAGIYIIYKHSKQARFVRPDLMTPEKYIQTMFLDKYDNTIWMGGENQLINISYVGGNIKVNHAEVFRSVNYITERDAETLWIGTKDGLYIFDKQTHEKQRVELPLERFKVNTIHREADGTLYIGTHHNGLVVYNEKSNYYYKYDKSNSALTNDCMKCIVNADNGSLFISSDAGIVRFDKRTKRITTWTSDQGLQNINFSIRAGTRTHQRTMMFAGDNGVIEISENANLPHIYKAKLVLSDLYIGNTRVTPDSEDSPIRDAVNNVKKIRLSNSQSNAAIKVKCINHIYPSDCVVTWTLDNPNKENVRWNPLNEDRLITFNGLKAGKYNLTIQAISNESGEKLDERTITAIIRPPFYLSFVGLLVEFFIVFIIFILTRKYLKSANAMHITNDKINFFINTAHDIRTPLALIKAPLEELNQNTSLGVEEREAVSMALRNTNMLSHMTDSVMRYELASIEKGITRIERHEAIAHFQSQIDKISQLAQTKHQTIIFEHPDEPFEIWVDTRKLNSIIQNLLSNAIKYSEEGDSIVLHLYSESKNWGFHVTDNGIGICEEGQEKLFKQIFRATNAINAKTFGFGLGLISIYRYVTQMKGRIDVKSILNEGSDFHIRFPRGKKHYDIQTTEFVETPDVPTHALPQVSIPQFDDGTSTDDQRHRLLIVEDNPEMLGYLKRMFDKDFIVYTATNGKEAMSKLPYIQPLIVLSDVMMPEMRGDDLCVSIKSNIDTSHIAVVLISALSDQQSIINGLSVKADAYVTKPFDTKILQLTINNLVESRLQLRQQLSSLDTINDNFPDSTSELDLKMMAEMKEIIENNLSNNDFTVDTLAYELRVSRTSLYNKIKGLTGNTPSDMIRTYRINKAKTLLHDHHHTISEVAEMVGFSDQKYFREVFKKAVGMTPSEYAKSKD